MNVYQVNGYKDRKDYFKNHLQDFDMDYKDVVMIANHSRRK